MQLTKLTKAELEARQRKLEIQMADLIKDLKDQYGLGLAEVQRRASAAGAGAEPTLEDA